MADEEDLRRHGPTETFSYHENMKDEAWVEICAHLEIWLVESKESIKETYISFSAYLRREGIVSQDFPEHYNTRITLEEYMR